MGKTAAEQKSTGVSVKKKKPWTGKQTQIVPSAWANCHLRAMCGQETTPGIFAFCARETLNPHPLFFLGAILISAQVLNSFQSTPGGYLLDLLGLGPNDSLFSLNTPQ